MIHDFKQLSELADVNPPLGVSLADSDEVSFVPMGAFSEITASVTAEEFRDYGSVKKGFTAFRNGDVIFAKITPCFENGKIGLAELSHDVGFGSTEFHVIRAKSEKADPRFLHHFLRQKSVRASGAKRMTGSAGQRRVPRAFLETLPIPAFPLEEQRRIAAILDRAEELRAKRRAAIALLDQLPQAIFLEMFGDPRANQKGWRELPLREAVNGTSGVKAGPFGSSIKKEDYVSAGYRVYGQEQVIAGRLDMGDYYIDERKYRKLESCAVQPGDLLMSLVGSFGRVLVVPEGIEPGIINPRLLKIAPSKQLMSSTFLANQLQFPSVQSRLSRAAHGGTMGVLNAGILKELVIVVPPLDLQHHFAARIEAICRAKATQQSSLATLATLFASLQHCAFPACR